MPDFSDPAKKRQEEIDELDDLLDRQQKQLREVRREIKTLQRHEELLDGEVADLEKEIDAKKREDERIRVLGSMENIGEGEDEKEEQNTPNNEQE